MYRRLAVISFQLEELGLTHERNVDVLLRRMSGTQEIAPLKLLASIVEPVKDIIAVNKTGNNADSFNWPG
jgi:hexosaminidase